MSDVSALGAAVPFWIGAGLLVASAIVTALVTERMKQHYALWLQEAGVAADDMPYEFSPVPLSRLVGFIADAAQSLVVIVAPGVGYLFLQGRGLGTAVALLYGFVVLLGFVALAYFLLTQSPDRYARFVWVRVFTPLTVVGVGVNLVASVLVLLLGP